MVFLLPPPQPLDIHNCNTSYISVYGGKSIPVIGRVIIQVWRASKRYKLECKLIDSESPSIAWQKACLGMNVIHYLDNNWMCMLDFGMHN